MKNPSKFLATLLSAVALTSSAGAVKPEPSSETSTKSQTKTDEPVALPDDLIHFRDEILSQTLLIKLSRRSGTCSITEEKLKSATEKLYNEFKLSKERSSEEVYPIIKSIVGIRAIKNIIDSGYIPLDYCGENVLMLEEIREQLRTVHNMERYYLVGFDFKEEDLINLICIRNLREGVEPISSVQFDSVEICCNDKSITILFSKKAGSSCSVGITIK